ncbi:MAG: DUF5103 domain-containing protein [Chitinophagales bacterium]
MHFFCQVAYAQPIPDTLLEVIPAPVTEQNGIPEVVNDPMIHTVMLERNDLSLAYPILSLGSEDKLTLSFDVLGGIVHNYSYTFLHCDQNWEASNLTNFDYLDGFENNPVSDYRFSFATEQKYVHYSVSFPNESVNFTLSGNYVVVVYDDNYPDSVIIARRFFVWEDVVSVSASVSRPNRIEYRTEYQEVNFTVDVRNAGITNAYDAVRVSVFQNGITERAPENLKPRLISGDILYYDMDDQVFPGMKEFRRFDSRNLKLQTDRIRKITHDMDGYVAYLNVEESRVFERYRYEKDINGQYVIMADLSNDVGTEADYVWVDFTMKYPYFVTSGDFYVFGGLSDMQCLERCKMTYDFDRQEYHARIYLKQGYYNYLYAFKNYADGKVDFAYAEGNDFQTENDYLILIYQRSFDRDYDKLIGLSVINSLKK